VTHLIDPGPAAKRYRTILADPPWPESGGGKRGAQNHYPLMSVKEICALGQQVRELADPSGCHLYLWVTNNYLRDGFDVLDAWGFEYITLITWEKDRAGLGQYFRGITEHIMFARRGDPLPYKIIDGKRAQGMTIIKRPRTKHSAKPESFRRVAERVSYEPRLEMFCRAPRPGWASWGNEVKSDVEISTASDVGQQELGL
jgi:N6-adenosine-specific RNA methylase IME4